MQLSGVFRRKAVINSLFVNAGDLWDDVVHLFVCLFVCLSVAWHRVYTKSCFLKKTKQFRDVASIDDQQEVLHALSKEPILGPLWWPWKIANLAPWPSANPVETSVKFVLAAGAYWWRRERPILVISYSDSRRCIVSSLQSATLDQWVSK